MTLAELKSGLFLRYLCYQARPARLKKYLKARIPSAVRHNRQGRLVRAAATQVELKLFPDILIYAENMRQHVALAAREGADLVVFPEDNGLGLLGLVPGMAEASAGSMDEALQGLGREVKVADIFHYLSPLTIRAVQGIFPALAQNYGVYLAAGSFLVARGSETVNRSFLFGPDGRLIGTHDKVNLLPLEREWGIVPGAGLSVYSTAIGRLAIPICMDATYFETFRILERLGAQIVALGTADPQEYNYWLALRGIWPRVQESLVFGVKSALVGQAFGFTLTGKAGIYAPLELTSGQSGVLAETTAPEQAGLAVADLDLDRLEELKRNHPWWGDFNHKLYEQYWPELYQKQL